ncbi:MAG: MBL fold metallo-hydrolase [Candidatus Lokiarchaeota archaeon]|nr:MBL fold metallo-hydrolase [Candidatus Lokiarchaeota archaeon]
MSSVKFEKICENVFLFRDAVNVYVVKKGDEAVLIDFGSGEVLNCIKDLGINHIEYILHTHYHRDQCYGDKIALEEGIKIAAPYKERKLFTSAENFWKKRTYYNIYYFKPTFFVSTYNIPLALTLKKGDIFEWESYNFEIIRTPGHTSESISYFLNVDNKNLIFSGDLIHSGGRVITYYDLEYLYNDNGEGGIKRSLESFESLMEHNPDILLPSHGDIIYKPKKDIENLKQKFERARLVFCSRYSGIDYMSTELQEKAIPGVDMENEFPHLFHQGTCPPFVLKGKENNALLIDFAGDDEQGYSLPKFEKILRELNVEKIDIVIPTHYHDDHVSGIPLIQEKYNARVYALQNMVDVLENPTHYRLGCLTDISIKVDKVLEDGERFKWDEYNFQVFHFPGQTEYHMGLFGNIDGREVFFTGDTITERTLVDRDTNINGLNFCKLGDNVGFMKCAELLLKCRPDYLAISHYGIIKVDDKLLKKYKKIVSEYEHTIESIAAQDNPNFALDPNWICFKPIRIITMPGNTFETNLLIRNYADTQSELEFRLNIPEAWSANPLSGSLKLKENTIQNIPIKITIPKDENRSGRTIITANIIWRGRNLGPLPDLMVDHGFSPPKEWRAWDPIESINHLLWTIKQMKQMKGYFR